MPDDNDYTAPERTCPPTDPPPPEEASPLPEIPPPAPLPSLTAPEPLPSLTDLVAGMSEDELNELMRQAQQRREQRLALAKAQRAEACPVAPSAMFKTPLRGDTGLESARQGRSGAKAARIDYIVELMSTLKFRRGKTAKELAKKWNLDLAYVQTLTAEASKIVRASVMDKDQIQVNVTVALEKLIQSCLDDNEAYDGNRSFFKNEAVAIQNRKCAIEGLRALGSVTGAEAAKRTEFSGPDGGPIQSQTAAAIAGLDDDQITELLGQHYEKRKARMAQVTVVQPEPEEEPEPTEPDQ